MMHIKQACEQYHGEFNAYPGPADDELIDGTAATAFKARPKPLPRSHTPLLSPQRRHSHEGQSGHPHLV